MPYVAIKTIASSFGHFPEGEKVPRSKVPDEILKSWEASGSVEFREVVLDDEDEEPEPVPEPIDDGADDERIPDETEVSVETPDDPSQSQPTTKRKKPQWGKK